jgi:hypothetical protein
MAEELFEEGRLLCPTVWEKQNGHGVLEFIVRELTLLQNGTWASTNLWERHHTESGKKLSQSKVKDKGLEAMRRWSRLFCMRYLWHGGGFGPDCEYALTPVAMELMRGSKLLRLLSPMMDYRPGEPASVKDGYIASGWWRPVKYDVAAARTKPSARLLKSIGGFLAVTFLGEDGKTLPDFGENPIEIRYPSVVELRDPDDFTRQAQLRPGDDFVVCLSCSCVLVFVCLVL